MDNKAADALSRVAATLNSVGVNITKFDSIKEKYPSMFGLQRDLFFNFRKQIQNHFVIWDGFLF